MVGLRVVQPGEGGPEQSLHQKIVARLEAEGIDGCDLWVVIVRSARGVIVMAQPDADGDAVAHLLMRSYDAWTDPDI